MPDFKPGDTVVVQVKVVEGDRERVQAYEGVVIAKSNRGLNSSFTVRKISHGEGVERVFQTYSPAISDVASSAAAACGAPSSTICAICPARPRASKRRSEPGTVDEHALRSDSFTGLWRGLDVLRRFLHLVVLLFIFGFVIGALRGSMPTCRSGGAGGRPEGRLVEQLVRRSAAARLEEARGKEHAETLLWDLTDSDPRGRQRQAHSGAGAGPRSD